MWLFRKTLSPGAQSIISCRCLWLTNEPNECHNLLGPWSSLLQDPTSRRQFLITFFFSIQWENRWDSALNFADCLADMKVLLALLAMPTRTPSLIKRDELERVWDLLPLDWRWLGEWELTGRYQVYYQFCYFLSDFQHLEKGNEIEETQRRQEIRGK